MYKRPNDIQIHKKGSKRRILKADTKVGTNIPRSPQDLEERKHTLNKFKKINKGTN
jgi:hypothetical protein